jgi:hypothetical protein
MVFQSLLYDGPSPSKPLLRPYVFMQGHTTARYQPSSASPSTQSRNQVPKHKIGECPVTKTEYFFTELIK